ncbi:uncharacterized protein, partial [Littorina saxatilis]|uniref:uncharacterized protein n=1 Tax=Littorina saxatilis TaxID=31220 RepID=UPI0038B65D72
GGGGEGGRRKDGGGWCEVTISVCSTCKIKLTLVTLTFPSCDGTERRGKHRQSGRASSYKYHCIPGCNYLHVNEVVYPYNRENHASFHATDQGRTFTSISSQVKLRHCFSGAPEGKSFTVEFQILDKNVLHQGVVSQYRKSMGTLRAPNFPKGYALNGETFTYMIQNLDPYGHVRLIAIDWDIAPESEVKIYDGFGQAEPSMVLERFHRPVLVSKTNTLVLVFNTGSSRRPCCFHSGFKISYEFVSDDSWPQKPITDCSAVYSMEGGGMFDFTGASDATSLYDCIWVIKKQSHENKADGVVLRLTEDLLGDGWLQYGRMNTLDVHGGATSESPLLYRFTARNLTHGPDSYYSPDGLFVRLRGGFYSTDKLSFIFTAVKNVSLEGSGCPGVVDFLCQNLLCIDQDLRCDGIDHCGDESDESPILDCSMSALWRLSFKWSMPYVAGELPGLRTTVCSGFPCRVDGRCLATSMLCDGVPDCVDGEDERICYATTQAYSSASTTARGFMLAIIPSVLSTTVLAIVCR